MILRALNNGNRNGNGNGGPRLSRRDVRNALVVAFMDFTIVFLLTLPTFNIPSIMDIYASLKVAMMVFVFSLAKELKIRLHYREALRSLRADVDRAFESGYNKGREECERRLTQGRSSGCSTEKRSSGQR